MQPCAPSFHTVFQKISMKEMNNTDMAETDRRPGDARGSLLCSISFVLAGNSQIVYSLQYTRKMKDQEINRLERN